MIVLDAPAERIMQRKQEVPLSECKRQTEAYRELARTESFARLVNADRSPDVVKDEAEGLIIDYLVKRQRKRLARY
jgi:hypothetical protein